MDSKNRLQHLSELFDLATNYSGTGVCVIDANTREIYFCNNARFFLSGGKPIKYQGLKCHQALFNSEQPCANCPLVEVRLGKNEHIIQGHEAGTTFKIKSQILQWEDKEVMVELVTDISEDHKCLEQIQKEKVIKKDIFDLAKTKMLNNSDLISYIIYDLTNDKFVTTASGKYCDLTQYTNGSALSVFAQKMSKIVIDDQKRSEYISVHNRCDLLKNFYAGKKDIQLDLEMKLGNGQERWERIELLTAEHPDNGAIYLFEYAYDIHKEKNVEIMMNYAVNDEYDLIGIVNFNTADCVMMYGENSYNVFGKNVVEDNYNVSIERFVKNGIKDECQESYGQQLSLLNVQEYLKKHKVYEIIFPTKYGKENRVKRDRFTLYSADNNYCLFTQTDITEILEIEKAKRNELEIALNNANAATRAKSVFLSRMSHEIRTPLNAIIGINDLVQDDLQKGNLDVQAFIEHTNDISASSKYLLSLLNDILDTSKIESGKMKIHSFVVNMQEFLDNIHALSNSLAEEREIEFHLNRRGQSQTCYEFDGVHVQQIIMNLLSNAFKYTPPGGHVELEVKFLSNDGTNPKIQFVVQDDGIGMSQEFQKEMFESFTQENTDYTSKYGGSGLGLNLVRELVQMMQGTINVVSEKDHGSRFTVTLDVKNVTMEQSSNVASCVIQDIDALDFQGLRILLCEDHPMNQKITQMLLNRKNAIVDIARDGIVGWQTFANSPQNYYQLILMDIRMPNMDGIATAKKIRSLDRQDAQTVPIVALSANAYEEDIQESKEAGMNGHLSKPIDPKLLFNTIARLTKK